MLYPGYLSHPTPLDLQLAGLQPLWPQQLIEHEPILPWHMNNSASFTLSPLRVVQPHQSLLLGKITDVMMVHLASGEIALFEP